MIGLGLPNQRKKEREKILERRSEGRLLHLNPVYKNKEGWIVMDQEIHEKTKSGFTGPPLGLLEEQK